MAVSLRSCPFCGGEAKVYFGQQTFIGCNLCRVKSAGYSTHEIAISAWNQRVGYANHSQTDLLERILAQMNPDSFKSTPIKEPKTTDLQALATLRTTLVIAAMELFKKDVCGPLAEAAKEFLIREFKE